MADHNATPKTRKKRRTSPTASEPFRRLHVFARRHLRPSFQSQKRQLTANLLAFLSEKQLTLWVLAALLGPVIAYAAISFRLLIGGFQSLWLGTSSERMISAAYLTPGWVLVLAPTVAGIVVGLFLDKWLPGKRAHSVADVIEAKALNDCRIGVKTGLLSALASAFSLGFGASAGREGPVVHLGATLTAWIEGKFDLSRSARRTLFAAGIAAAISASFNAPIAAVLFAHEIILQHYALRAFIPVVIASVAAGVVTRVHFGTDAAFIIPSIEIASMWEFPAFVILGIVCAGVAVVFQLCIRGTQFAFLKFDVPLWWKTAFAGFVVGVIALQFPHVLGVGYAATDEALSQQYALPLLLMLIFAKIVATSVTLSSGFSTGIFSPSLYLGAMTGAAFGLIATSAVPDVSTSSTSLYTVLGMGGVAAAVLGAPISTTMIVFELTGGFGMAIALLVTISIATGLTYACLGRSFFHWQLEKRGLLLHDGPHRAILRQSVVADFMTPVDDQDSDARLESAQETALKASDSLEHALRTFSRVGDSVLPVVDETDGVRIIARAQRITALNHYNQALVDAHIEEHR